MLQQTPMSTSDEYYSQTISHLLQAATAYLAVISGGRCPYRGDIDESEIGTITVTHETDGSESPMDIYSLV